MRSSSSAPPDTRARKSAAPWLCDAPYAHRGLHGPGVPENSRSAFRAAIAARVGIELDVRLSGDGFAVVFHDAELHRMTGEAGPVAKRTVAGLARLRLAASADRIETLAETLTLVAGRAPVLIELKTDGDAHVAARLALSVRHALEGYGGHAGVMSFDPAVGRWFAAHAPRVPRGLVVGKLGSLRRMLRLLLCLRVAQPHFLACDLSTLPSWIVRAVRARGVPVLGWTVRTDAEDARAGPLSDQIMFENV